MEKTATLASKEIAMRAYQVSAVVLALVVTGCDQRGKKLEALQVATATLEEESLKLRTMIDQRAKEIERIKEDAFQKTLPEKLRDLPDDRDDAKNQKRNDPDTVLRRGDFRILMAPVTNDESKWYDLPARVRDPERQATLREVIERSRELPISSSIIEQRALVERLKRDCTDAETALQD